ncbi:stress responsive protein [Amylibacter marinus]|uniref:Stress responsive protein n=1 Tax=Amylibacter marinus TaxID=1475483 RepID=A0ABQ5VUJ8_9RHOB|nr:Dabb family protein [Amylibacter marinus]GLQ35112.1 stress responsive protein [Amylibacter marinus]
MIRHIVFFNAKDPKDIETIFQGLSTLSEIPHCDAFEVGRNMRTDRISEEGPDFVVYAEFADQEQLDAYKAHPIYAESIRIVRPLRDMRIAADFLSDS